MVIKKGDFVEVEYTGKLKNDDRIFDTTDVKLAEKEGIKNPNIEYGSIIVCIGENQIARFLDKEIEGKEAGKGYEADIKSEDAFGKKDPKLIRTVSMSMFKKQKMNPYPGLQINAEGTIGTVRSVTGGRVVLDFNHPLSGRDLIYDFKILSIVEDLQKQAECVARFNLFPSSKIYTLKVDGEKLVISSKIDIPEPLLKNFKEKISKLIPKIKDIEFSVEKKKITTKE